MKARAPSDRAIDSAMGPSWIRAPPRSPLFDASGATSARRGAGAAASARAMPDGASIAQPVPPRSGRVRRWADADGITSIAPKSNAGAPAAEAFVTAGAANMVGALLLEGDELCWRRVLTGLLDRRRERPRRFKPLCAGPSPQQPLSHPARTEILKVRTSVVDLHVGAGGSGPRWDDPSVDVGGSGPRWDDPSVDVGGAGPRWDDPSVDVGGSGPRFSDLQVDVGGSGPGLGAMRPAEGRVGTLGMRLASRSVGGRTPERAKKRCATRISWVSRRTTGWARWCSPSRSCPIE